MTVFSHGNKIFYWDRRENFGQAGISLSELFIFYKIKQFADLREISGSYEEYEYWQGRVRSILRSFADFPISLDDQHLWRCIPRRIGDAYSELREAVLLDGMTYCAKLGKDFDKVINFFEKKFPGQVLMKMEFELKTPNGSDEVSLAFAENFRFKPNPDSFNIFNLRKEDRNIVIPQDKDSVIFAVDFRQFEFRTFLELRGLQDYLVHDNLYEKLGTELEMTTNDLKVGIISYLYGHHKNEKFEKFFKKEQLLGQIEHNIFWWKEMPVYVPENTADGKKVHTIVQTISQYRYLEKLDKVLQMLQNRQSKFIFPLHDSIILSLSKDEDEIIDEIFDILEDDIYKIKGYIGPNYRDIVEI